MNRHSVSGSAVLAAALLVVGVGLASAEMSKGVLGALRGQLVVSKGELSLEDGKNDKETIAKIKAAKLSELSGQTTDDVTYWRFHYTAFLNKTGATSLKMEFYLGKQYSADKRLDGIDPKSPVLTGDISIDENEGLARGKSYLIKLVTDKDVLVASTTVTFK